MSSLTTGAPPAGRRGLSGLRFDTALAASYAPGILLALAVAAAGGLAAWVIDLLSKAVFGAAWSPPVMALTLLIGLSVHALAWRPRCAAGLGFCGSSMLRMLVAMLGLRVTAGDLVGLGLDVAVAVGLIMSITILGTIWLAGRLSCTPLVGVMMGSANAVCGAAATLATSSALPSFPGKQANILLTVVLANAVSTAAMLLYPLAGTLCGLTPMQIGVLVGASIQDVAQVVGAGLALPPEAGNAAIAVKMFRVLMLVPVVVVTAWWFAPEACEGQARRPMVPRFAIGFVALCALNSVLTAIPVVADVYAPVRTLLIEATGWGLLVAIAALGLQTPLSGMTALGVRPVALFLAATASIFVLSLAAVRFVVH